MTKFESHPLHPGVGLPLFIAAGILKEPAQFDPFIKIGEAVAGLVLIAGGMTKPKWNGNAQPGETDFVYDAESGIAGNARGLPGPGHEGIIRLKTPIKHLAKLGIDVLIQVTNLPHEKPLEVVPELIEIALDSNPLGIEVNLSCPNGRKPDGSLHVPVCNDADASGELMAAIRERVGRDPLIGIKDSPHVGSLNESVNCRSVEALARAVVPFIDYVSGINTIGGQPFPEITCTGGKGGMSGPIVAPVARQHIKSWQEFAPSIPYLSCGGVESSNIHTEIPERLAEPNVIRVGGAQEFYRSGRPDLLIERWAQAL